MMMMMIMMTMMMMMNMTGPGAAQLGWPSGRGTRGPPRRSPPMRRAPPPRGSATTTARQLRGRIPGAPGPGQSRRRSSRSRGSVGLDVVLFIAFFAACCVVHGAAELALHLCVAHDAQALVLDARSLDEGRAR